MLHYETIDSRALELLKKIQEVPEFAQLRLVGGTALALLTGHRRSLDLDLFGEITTDPLQMLNRLNAIGKVTILKRTENIHIFNIDDLKVDIVNYPYKWIKDEVLTDNLKIADKPDIAAMKLSAITGRGTKKDFIDLFFLLKSFKLSELMNYYTLKYQDGSSFLVLKSLTYFEDADQDEMPYMLESVAWELVKNHIAGEVEGYLKSL